MSKTLAYSDRHGAKAAKFLVSRMDYTAKDALTANSLPLTAEQTFQGKINDMTFWKRGLECAELQKIYEAGRKGAAFSKLLQLDK